MCFVLRKEQRLYWTLSAFSALSFELGGNETKFLVTLDYYACPCFLEFRTVF